MTKKDAVMVDVDGTLVDVSSIRYLVEGDRRDFDAFHRASVDCPPIMAVVKRVQNLREAGIAVVVVSGREERFRRLTDFWIAMWHIPCDLLVMRSSGDWRSDVIIKKEIFDRISESFTVVEVIDDRKELLEMWQSLEIPSVVDAQELARLESN